MVDRARNAPVLMPRVPRPTRPRCWMALRRGCFVAGRSRDEKPLAGSPGANRRCAGWFCLFRTQRLDDERRLVPLRAPARRLARCRAARNRVGAAGCLAGARAHGLAVLVELAGRDARRLGRGFVRVGPARRARTASCLRRRASWAYAARRRGAWRDVRVPGRPVRRLDVARQLAEQDQRLAQVVYRGAGQLVADFRQHGLARLAIVTAGADLDQAMGSQRPVDFLSTASVRPLSPIRTTGRRGERRTEGRCARGR